MTVINLSWYRCVLFAVALAFSSAITVAPGGQAWMRLEMGIWLASVDPVLRRSPLSSSCGMFRSPSGCCGFSSVLQCWQP